jgi:hypothetical protein
MGQGGRGNIRLKAVGVSVADMPKAKTLGLSCLTIPVSHLIAEGQSTVGPFSAWIGDPPTGVSLHGCYWIIQSHVYYPE